MHGVIPTQDAVNQSINLKDFIPMWGVDPDYKKQPFYKDRV